MGARHERAAHSEGGGKGHVKTPTSGTSTKTPCAPPGPSCDSTGTATPNGPSAAGHTTPSRSQTAHGGAAPRTDPRGGCVRRVLGGPPPDGRGLRGGARGRGPCALGPRGRGVGRGALAPRRERGRGWGDVPAVRDDGAGVVPGGAHARGRWRARGADQALPLGARGTVPDVGRAGGRGDEGAGGAWGAEGLWALGLSSRSEEGLRGPRSASHWGS